MLPDPLHPALVHFPVVLVILLPVVALTTLVAIRRGGRPRRLWSITVLTACALAASSWVAVETGEREEERVERVVPETSLHAHEEAGERFLALSGALFVLTAAGLLGGRSGRLARLGALVGAVGLVAAGVQVGHSGGTLVYRDGAASAYVEPVTAVRSTSLRTAEQDHD